VSSKQTGPIASFVRFVICGGGTGIASSAALVQLSGTMSMAVANAIVTVVSTLLANELHSRITFGNGRASLAVHLQSSGTAAVCYLFTTAAMLVLDAVAANPGALTEQAVYLAASGLAGIGRFVVLRIFVFARPKAAEATAPAVVEAKKPVAAPVFGRAEVAVAA
jgi:putative flippase GtrA